MKMKKWSSQWTQFVQLRKEAWKNFRTSTGFEPVTSRLPGRCSTNWAMKPLTLGEGQLWVHMFPWKKWVLMIYEINHIWPAEMKWKWRSDRRSERNFCNCVKKPGSCGPTMLRPFVRGFVGKISVYKQTFLLFKCAKLWNKKSFVLRANNSLVGTLISIGRWRQPYLRYTDPEGTSFWLDRNILLICFINAWVALPYNFTSCSFLKTLKVKLRFFSLRNITTLSGK